MAEAARHATKTVETWLAAWKRREGAADVERVLALAEARGKAGEIAVDRTARLQKCAREWRQARLPAKARDRLP